MEKHRDRISTPVTALIVIVALVIGIVGGYFVAPTPAGVTTTVTATETRTVTVERSVTTQVTTTAPPTTHERVDITVWTNWPARWDDNAVGRVLRENLGYDYVHVAHEEKDLGDIEELTLLAVQTGMGGPDVAQIEWPHVTAFYKSGGLLDLTDKVMPYKDKFPDFHWNMMTYKGRVYAVFYDLSSCGVMYRTDLFAKYGLKTPDKWDSWDDVVTEGRKLKAQNKSAYMFNVWNDPSIYLAFAQAKGVQVFEESPDGEIKVLLDSPEFIAVAEWLDSLVKEGICFYGDYASYWPPLTDGTMLMDVPFPAWNSWFATTAVPPEMQAMSGKWRVVEFPPFEKGKPTSCIWGGSVLAIPAHTKHPEEAWAYIYACTMSMEYFLRGPELFQEYPANVYLPMLERPELNEPYPYFNGSSPFTPCIKALQYLPQITVTEYYAVMEEQLGLAVNAIIVEGVPIETALKQAADNVRAEIAG